MLLLPLPVVSFMFHIVQLLKKGKNQYRTSIIAFRLAVKLCKYVA